jgi:Flp pilus assembly protein TadD
MTTWHRYSPAWMLTFALVAALAGSACSKNPEASKREEVAKGDKDFAAQRFPEAIIEYRKAIQIDPRYGEARLKLATAYASVGDGPNALREYARAADLMPDDASAQIKAGTFMLLATRYRDAQSLASHVLEKDPKNVDAQILYANALAGLKDLNGAVTALEKAIELDATRSSSYADLGSIQLVSGNREAAEAAFRRAVEIAPRSADAHLSLANFLWAVGKADEAKQELSKALEIEPRNAVANRAMALYYLLTGKPEGAEPYLKTVVDVTKAPATKLFLAEYYIRSAREADARAVLEPLTKEKDSFEAASLRLAQLDLIARKEADAARRVDAVLAKSPNSAPALVVSARVVLAQGDAIGALRKVQAAITADPQSGEAQYVLGQTYLALNRTDEAVSAFNESLKINPKTQAPRLALAQTQLKAGKADDAAQLATEILSADPGQLDARLLLVQALVMKHDLAAADRQIKILLANRPDSSAVQTAAGLIAALRNDAEGSRTAYRQALAAEPNNVSALSGLLNVETTTHKFSVARGVIEDRLKEKPNDPTLMVLAAQTYYAIGEADETEKMLRKAIEAEPGNIQAYGMLGKLYYQQGRLDLARKDLEELTKNQPKSVAAQTMLGTVLELQNRVEDAKDRYGRALALDPRAPVAANNLAWLSAQTDGNLDVALQLAQTAKSQMPTRHEVDDTLGWIYYKKGLASLAVGSLKNSVTSQPDNPMYLYHLGMAYARNGEKKNARDTLEKALRVGQNKFDGAAEARKTLDSLKE